MTRPCAVTLILLASAVLAQSPAVERWDAAALSAIDTEVVRKNDGVKASSRVLVRTPTSLAAVNHRVRSGAAELHEEMADFFVVRKGRAALIVGGELINRRLVGKGEHLADGIQGGQSHKLEPGDVMHVPPNTPHQMVVAPGESVTYLLIKAKE